MSTKEQKQKSDPEKKDWRRIAAEILQKASALKYESLRLEGEYRLLKKLIDDEVL